MPKDVSHEEIAQRFVDANVIDFKAAGNLIAELGPVWAVHDRGWHGVNFGRFNFQVVCIPPYDAARVVGNLGNVAAVTAAIEAAE
jgi:hypothetical protein